MASSKIPLILRRDATTILDEWIGAHTAARGTSTTASALREPGARFLLALGDAISSSDDITTTEWGAVRDLLSDISRSHVRHGSSPAETAGFILSLKHPLFERLRTEHGADVDSLFADVWAATDLVDRLVLFTTESYQKGREEVITRQNQELIELSTPVVTLWEGILALPLIGTLDSSRTQVAMESLLQRIVETRSGIAILDITGVATVDTLVAQHLLKTVAAARLMGADCIISGLRPQIAQTLVHLGVALGDVITKPTLADAFAVALKRLGLTVRRLEP